MCRCTPSIRTPFCGRGDCHPPRPEGVRPTASLPRITIGLTFSEAQLARIEEMIERYNATRNPITTDPMRNYEQCIAGGLVALEALIFDLQPGHVSVFEKQP